MPNTDHQDGPDRNRDRQRVETSEAAAEVQSEIEALHDFFVGWFRGTISNDDDTFQAGFARRFDPGFILIAPGGTVLPLATLTKAIRAGHGSNPEFRIAIRNVVLRRELGKHVVATYEEWQRNALNSTPSDNGRLSSALLERAPVAPGGFAWLHLHECWLPDDIIAAGPYDF